MRAFGEQDNQPWVTCFLARVLIDYAEETTQADLDYPSLFDDLEGFDTPSDAESFLSRT